MTNAATRPAELQLYPNWLDGEHVRIASARRAAGEYLRDTERAMKVHALLGTQFVLSDIQVVDSAAVLRLFADPAFRAFVADERDFLEMRVTAKDGLGDAPYQLAVRGLQRARATGWVSSVFGTATDPIRDLAEELLGFAERHEADRLDRPTAAAAKHPQCAADLEAVRHAVRYFGRLDAPRVVPSTTAEPTTYYKVLSDWAEAVAERAPGSVEHARLDATIDFVNDHVRDVEARGFRSSVYRVLHAAGPAERQDVIWHHVVQAWNFATQRTLAPRGGSSGALPQAPPPGPYLEQFTDTLLTMRVSELTGVLATVYERAQLPIDLDRLSWGRVSELQHEACTTRLVLREARLGGDPRAVEVALDAHLRALACRIHPTKSLANMKFAMTVGAGVVGVFTIGTRDDPGLVAYLSAFGGAAKVAADVWDDQLAPRIRQRRLVSTLARAIADAP